MNQANRALLSALLAASLLVACGGGGGGGGGGGPTTPPPPAPQFTPATGGGPTSLALGQGAASTSTSLFLELRASNVQNLYGLSFELSYPAAVLSYRRTLEGPFLTSDGASASIQASSPAPGRIVVGATRLGASGGLGGGGLVLTLEFALAGTGSGDINFSDTRTFSPNGQAQIGVSWLGGTVRAGV